MSGIRTHVRGLDDVYMAIDQIIGVIVTIVLGLTGWGLITLIGLDSKIAGFAQWLHSHDQLDAERMEHINTRFDSINAEIKEPLREIKEEISRMRDRMGKMEASMSRGEQGKWEKGSERRGI